MAGWIYILRSFKNGTYYIGSTDDIERREIEHATGKSKYTKHLLPVKLVFKQKLDSLLEARKIEYKLKRFKSREIIEQIIIDGYIKLVRR